MADVNLPSFSDLSNMEFMSPMAFQQAQNQIGLANQFQNQNLAMGQEDLRAKSLANMYSEQANPLRVKQLGLQNEGTSYDNATKGVESRVKTQTEKEQIQAARSKLLASMDDDKLKMFMSQASMDLMSDDPQVAARAQKKIMASKEELERRNKQKDELEKIAAQGENSKAVANIHAGATLGAAKIGADSRAALANAKAKGVMDFEQAVATGKISTDKALTYAAYKAQTAEDPEERAMWTNRARQFEQIVNNKAAAAKVGNPDVGAMANIPTIQAPSAFGASTAPAPSTGRVSVVSPDGKVGSIPADQLDAALKAGYKKR